MEVWQSGLGATPRFSRRRPLAQNSRQEPRESLRRSNKKNTWRNAAVHPLQEADHKAFRPFMLDPRVHGGWSSKADCVEKMEEEPRQRQPGGVQYCLIKLYYLPQSRKSSGDRSHSSTALKWLVAKQGMVVFRQKRRWRGPPRRHPSHPWRSGQQIWDVRRDSVMLWPLLRQEMSSWRRWLHRYGYPSISFPMLLDALPYPLPTVDCQASSRPARPSQGHRAGWCPCQGSKRVQGSLGNPPLPTYSHYASSRVSIPQTGKLLTWSRYTNASHEQTWKTTDQSHCWVWCQKSWKRWLTRP